MPKKEISALQGFLFSFFELIFMHPSILLPQRLEGFPGITFLLVYFFFLLLFAQLFLLLIVKLLDYE